MASTRLRVRLTPRASRDDVGVFEAGVLRVRVTAPPVDGRANEALIALLAKRLGVPKGAVVIMSGATSRLKLVEVAGLSEVEVRARLES